tara:strand:- start:1973 stop:2278 length:306 start_codon:yes stop_codon:yes gene_type:complete
MDKIDHVAIQTENIDKSVEWFLNKFKCNVKYQDESWAMIEFENMKIALVLPDQHPPHIAVTCDDIEKHGNPGKHRDGSDFLYIEGLDENIFELIRYSDNNK